LPAQHKQLNVEESELVFLSPQRYEGEEQNPAELVCDMIPYGIVHQVYTSGIPITVNDDSDLPTNITDSKIKSLCCLPMRNQGKNLGVLYLENTQTKYAFPLQQQIMLEHLAGQIANSIERTHLNINLQATLETIQKRNERLANLDNVKDEFVRTTSHEFRTPLNAILGLTDTLRETKLTMNQLQFCDSIYSSSELLLMVINDILDFQACQKNELLLTESRFELRTCLDECTRIASTNRSSKVVLNLLVDQVITNDMHIECDRKRLQQVISNLLSNALKFTDVGDVVVSAKVTEQHSELMTVLFQVRDSGIGIPKEKMKDLFKPYSQIHTKAEREFTGAGLGLALSQHIVRALSNDQSKLSCQSVQGKGSCFSFSLQMRYSHIVSSKPFQTTRYILRETVLLVTSPNKRTIRAIQDELGLAEFSAIEVVQSLGLAINVAKANLCQLPPRKQIVIFDTNVMQLSEVGTALARYQSDLQLNHISLIVVGAYDRRSQLLACIEEFPHNQSMVLCCRPFPKHSLLSAVGRVIENAMSSDILPPVEVPTERDPRTVRILMVEDNKVNQRVQLRLLSLLGFNTDVASNGKEGLTTFITNIDKEGVDLVLMDCHMPVMDGFESTKAIREYEKRNNLPHTHIVALTAGEHNIKPETGMCGIIQKPIKRESFELQLAQYLFHKECQTVTYERELLFELLYKR
jgi:signal transduction histidine kinase/CheY-like chemotaxis protein